jgi:2-polyprenyl-3-methyl-5-hydroxy-6-metoxy-1,4-benzoquinol methylase
MEADTALPDAHAHELATGARFAFGENWSRFLSTVDEERIGEACRSLRLMLNVESLNGSTMLDIGCGSGLFSLAAVRLGAELVHSFDFDPASVGCAQELRRRYAPDARWTTEQGSALDRGYVGSLGRFDLVYSWGVLHHTGDMLTAMDNVALPVAPGGTLFVSIYNDQGRRSRRWRLIKRIYNQLPAALRTPFVVLVMGPRELRSAVGAAIRLKPQVYVKAWTQYKQARGMSRWHDLVDWCGGYPFEVAKPESVFDFYRQRGFSLKGLKTAGGGLGCNEFVFEKER